MMILMFAGLTDVYSQQRGPRERPTPEQQADRRVKRMTEELQLNEEQQKTLKEFFTESFKKREESFDQNRPDRAKMQEQMQKEQEATNAKLKEVLTKEQYETYQQNEEKRRNERPRGPRPPHES